MPWRAICTRTNYKPPDACGTVSTEKIERNCEVDPRRRTLAQRVDFDAQELRIMGSKSKLLRTLVAASSAKILACPVLYRSGAPEERTRLLTETPIFVE
jgi:hypothetical protein